MNTKLPTVPDPLPDFTPCEAPNTLPATLFARYVDHNEGYPGHLTSLRGARNSRSYSNYDSETNTSAQVLNTGAADLPKRPQQAYNNANETRHAMRQAWQYHAEAAALAGYLSLFGVSTYPHDPAVETKRPLLKAARDHATQAEEAAAIVRDCENIMRQAIAAREAEIVAARAALSQARRDVAAKAQATRKANDRRAAREEYARQIHDTYPA